ncbi:DUF1704 domain-containing protein [Candidatus Woesearchaeota archaeon]|nr:DUF1704 domain-containing protein [Candidatus Woesearchaeota archaeon]
MGLSLTKIAALVADETLFNPVNVLEEKKKFFDDTSYNPRFTYKGLGFDPVALRQELEQFLQASQDGDERVSQLVQGRARELMKWLDLVEARGSGAFTHFSVELFGKPDAWLVAEAEQLLSGGKEKRVEQAIAAEEARRQLQAALDELGPGWRTVIDDALVADAHINPQLRLLRVRAGASFSPLEVKQLVVHEVGTHARRSFNGERQPSEVFVAGTAGYLETEEGLAVFHEEQAGCFDSFRKQQVGGRVIAIKEALSKSFAEVYAALLPRFGNETAFALTVRAKRGLGDTSKPGGLTKDLLYLKGLLRVRALSEEDRKYLYVGKVSYHHLPVIKEIVREGKVRLL